ncbi:MAG: aminoglycoside phosphotransferase, partial [Gammaproteobacteria bacterium]|nr:aminoglycoside phosphotransferase [Gammaproteobacteria bacterium]
LTYDAVSLLRDCYIQWPLDQTEAWALSYKNRLVKKNIIDDVKNEIFLKWFDLMGIQRHLKAIGIFSRLKLRDGKSSYLQDIPRTLDYITAVGSRYPETSELARFIREMVSFKP